jgi:hypothetical protein
MELLFGCFFAYVVIDAAARGNWASTILLMPFPLGFFYTGLCSLVRMLPSSVMQSPTTEETANQR